jgi:hypothetical protein
MPHPQPLDKTTFSTMKSITSIIARLVILSSLVHFITSCTTQSPHSGIFPFSTMEKPLSHKAAIRRSPDNTQPPERMTEVVRYQAHNSSTEKMLQHAIEQIQIGDVIAFYMSHEEARQHIGEGRIQKIPYELCRYGHLCIVVPNPNKKLNAQRSLDYRLLQVAMRQAITASDGLNYLNAKSWVVFRPPPRSINHDRLHGFTQSVIKKGSSPKKAYNYTAALGLWNGQTHPDTVDKIADQYTCTTLIISALNYSGYQLYSSRRHGIMDVITPCQVTESWGIRIP